MDVGCKSDSSEMASKEPDIEQPTLSGHSLKDTFPVDDMALLQLVEGCGKLRSCHTNNGKWDRRSSTPYDPFFLVSSQWTLGSFKWHPASCFVAVGIVVGGASIDFEAS